jgi:hypothetical protein
MREKRLPRQTKSVWHPAFANTQCIPRLDGHEWTQGDIVTGLVDSSAAQYAVIEARRTEGPSECFVITYTYS